MGFLVCNSRWNGMPPFWILVTDTRLARLVATEAKVDDSASRSKLVSRMIMKMFAPFVEGKHFNYPVTDLTLVVRCH